jgi:DNA modification methylase
VKMETGRIHQGDCIERLAKCDAECVHLAFADPPFNIGYEYDVYQDRKAYDKYLDWSRQWMSEIVRVLRPNGTFWLAIGDEYAAELKLIARDLGLSCRSWVIWYYTFGVNCTRKFNRSHAHLFHFVKNVKQFTFNFTDPDIRVPSARQLVYADKRANPRGRLPDDTWILRPQDVPAGFAQEQDTWYYPRVAGTFKERAGFHGCQMPEQLLGRIIRASSNEGDLVLDPFAGSGTTLTVAKKLKRDWVGFELSPEYARQATARVEGVKIGDPLDGSANPIASAPATPNSAGQSRRASIRQAVRVHSPDSKLIGPNGRQYSESETPIILAYLGSREGFSTDQILADPNLNAAFVGACIREGAPGSPRDWNRTLLKLRKTGRLPKVDVRRKRFRTDLQIDPFSFASEIAWRSIEMKRDLNSLDEIFCDPEAAAEFDRIAARYAPGYTAFEYRWAALWIRKRARKFRKLGISSHSSIADSRPPRLRRWSQLDFNTFGGQAGVYVVRTESEKLYVGATFDIKKRLELTRTSTEFDEVIGVSIKPILLPSTRNSHALHARQSTFIRMLHPPLNSSCWHAREEADSPSVRVNT